MRHLQNRYISIIDGGTYMTWNDYKQIVCGKIVSIGILDGQYVMERHIQGRMASEFRKITKEEYDAYETWCEDEQVIQKMRLKDIWCIGFSYTAEFRMINE